MQVYCIIAFTLFKIVSEWMHVNQENDRAYQGRIRIRRHPIELELSTTTTLHIVVSSSLYSRPESVFADLTLWQTLNTVSDFVSLRVN